VDKNEVQAWNSFIKYCLFQYDTKYDEDDVQNCWVKLLEISGSKEHVNLKSYLRDYIRHYSANKYNRKDPFVYTDMDQFYSDEGEPITIDLSSLDERSKQLIHYRFYEDMAWNQVAEKLGLSIQYTKELYHNILADLSGSSCVE
jgi:DNA-directed RNA polymerase specialized sigma subunit